MMNFPRRSIALAAASALLLVVAPAAAKKAADYAPRELLVRFKGGQDGRGAEAIRAIGAKVREKLSRIDVTRLDLPEGLDVEAAVKKLAALPFVEFAEPNYYYEPTWSTSDPRYGDQWGLAKIKTPTGWGIETGRREVVIAIVDTGVDMDHPDLVSKLVAGYDFVDNDDDPDDVGGHGTHCAGIAAASTNNGVGVAGVCANCSVMPVRVLGPSGGLASDVAKGIVWAVDHGAQVISMSLGGIWASSAQEDAVEYAWGKGAILVAAAGNSGVTDEHFPAYHSTCVAVGSSERNDSRSYFSNFGEWVDVAAPGSDIISAVPGGGYEWKSGTSMATPFVAGLAGLIWSELGAGATNAKVRAAIEGTADPVGDWVAHGRVNVGRALASVKTTAPPQKEPGKEPAKEPAKEPSVGKEAPLGHAIEKGSEIKAPKDALLASDDALLVLRSTQSGKRRYLDLTVTGRAKTTPTTESVKIVVEGRSYIDPIAFSAQLWNWRKSTWEWLGKLPLTTADTAFDLAKNGASAFVSDTGEIRLRLVGESDWFSTFDIGLDTISFSIEKKEADEGDGPPQDQGGSLGEKAAKAWKALTGGK